MKIAISPIYRAKAEKALAQVEEEISDLVKEVGEIVGGKLTPHTVAAGFAQPKTALVLVAERLDSLLRRREMLRGELKAAELVKAGRPSAVRLSDIPSTFWVDGITIDAVPDEWKVYDKAPSSLAYTTRYGWYSPLRVLYYGYPPRGGFHV